VRSRYRAAWCCEVGRTSWRHTDVVCWSRFSGCPSVAMRLVIDQPPQGGIVRGNDEDTS
jgi:hypothetical protein